ncbi:hypothetical protein QQX98_013196 [Neonectria punicea]|uniref:Hypervirulence associated protein TUDOR domain-containing protein n=1 Tax=Neonectria punicea TaxID=979145 RepID=A0ABR1GGN1_9HYPO
MPTEVKDKKSQPIKEGDEVRTPFRGGKREGGVEKVVMREGEEAKEADVKNPPKVIFTDQHRHRVAHNPGTLEHVTME